VSNRPLRIGFVDLVDAAPLVVAHENGFFSDEGLRVVLQRQLGWGSVRDRLTFGDLDAAHALLAMPLFSRLKRGGVLEPLVAIMNLGAGGDAITLSKRLFDANVRNAAAVARYARSMAPGERLVFAHVFNCSTHHYLLREWLASGGVDPDRDVELRVFPPNQMPGHMARGHVDGFGAGAPCNTIAARDAVGRIATLTTDIIPNHPEKVLATTARWAKAHADVLVPLVRAVIRGCAFCNDLANRDVVAELLSRPEYLATPVADLRRSLSMREDGAANPARSFAPAFTFPSKTHAAWMASEMVRWGELPAATDVRGIAESCADTTAYRAAAETLKLACPPNDFPPMPLRSGAYEAPVAAEAITS
jgi:ABC-type nitrate/sulfonate/bicarbonate transport system substrate-binding protein